MNLLRRFYAIGGAVALSLVFAGGEACAQSVFMTFSRVDGVASAPAPVPLSPWAMALLAVILALFARKALGRSALLILFGASLLMPYKTGLNEAYAYTRVTTFNLVFPSPIYSPDLAFDQDVSVVNATGKTIRINDVSEPPIDFIRYFHLAPPTLAPACAKGVILSPAAVCFVRVSQDYFRSAAPR